MKRILLLTSFLLLSACGGEDALGPAGNVKDFKNHFSVMSAFGEMNTFLESDPTDAAGLMPPTIPTLNFVADYSGCRTFVIGSDLTDDHYRVEYKCSKIPDSGALVDYNGYIEQDIQDRNDLSLGYSVSYDLDFYKKNSNGTHMSDTFEGLHSFKKTGGKFIREYSFLYAIEGDWDPTPVDYQVRRETKITYTPADMNDMFKKGKIEFEGLFEIAGLLGPDVNGRAVPKLKFGLSFSSKNLTYDDTCQSSGNLNGSVIYLDGANNKIEIVYNCNEIGLKIFLNGVEQQNFFNPQKPII